MDSAATADCALGDRLVGSLDIIGHGGGGLECLMLLSGLLEEEEQG